MTAKFSFRFSLLSFSDRRMVRQILQNFDCTVNCDLNQMVTDARSEIDEE